MEELKRGIKRVAEAQQQHNVNLWYKPDNHRRVRAAIAQITKNSTQQEILENKAFETFLRRNESRDMVFKIVKLQLLEIARNIHLTIPGALLRQAAAQGIKLQTPKHDSMQEAYEVSGREYADNRDFTAEAEKESRTTAFYGAIATLSESSKVALESFFDTGVMPKCFQTAVRELMSTLQSKGLEIEGELTQVLFNIRSFKGSSQKNQDHKVITFPSHKVPFNPVQLEMFGTSDSSQLQALTGNGQ